MLSDASPDGPADERQPKRLTGQYERLQLGLVRARVQSSPVRAMAPTAQARRDDAPEPMSPFQQRLRELQQQINWLK